MKNRKKGKHRGLLYIPGAAGDGFGFFPAVTCQIAERGESRVLWAVYQRRQQFPTKEEALAAADAEVGLAFHDHPSLASSPERLLARLRHRGFSEATDYRVAKSFDEDRRTALGDDFQPAFGEAAARHDPVLHAALMEMVKQQIADNDPPETRQTFERLLDEGYSPEYVRRMIGLLLVRGLNRGMFQGKPFDEKDYIENLRRLPEIPPP